MHASIRWVVVLASVLVGCTESEGNQMHAVLQDPVVHGVLASGEYRSQLPPGYEASRVATCGFSVLTGGGPGLWAEDPPWNVNGTWPFDECKFVSSSTASVVGTTCGGQVQFQQDGGKVTQVNSGAVTTGSGDGWILAFDDGSGGYVVQTNEATGAGCTTEVVNLISLRKSETPSLWHGCSLLIVKSRSGSCNNPDWVLSIFDSTH